jgi:hypothetical protein
MHDLLFENQERMGGPLFLELAEELELLQRRCARRLKTESSKLGSEATSPAASAAESMGLRLSSSTGCAMMDPSTSKVS